MRIGFLHLGYPGDSIVRYARLVASEISSQFDVDGEEFYLQLSGMNCMQKCAALRSAVGKLNLCDAVVLNLCATTHSLRWGTEFERLALFLVLAGFLRRPLHVTLHDSREVGTLSTIPTKILNFFSRTFSFLSFRNKNVHFEQIIRLKNEILRPLVFYLLFAKACRIVIFNRYEKKAISGLFQRKTAVIPMFFPEQQIVGPVNRGEAESKEIVLVGQVFPRKQYEFAIRALADLDNSYHMTICGDATPNCGWYLDWLLDMAKQLGLSNRIKVSGYLENEDLREKVDGGRLAICPYAENYSASNAIPYILSTSCPILCADIEFVSSINLQVPGLIPTFRSGSAADLLEKIKTSLDTPRTQLTQLDARLKLCNQFSLANIARQYLQDIESFAIKEHECLKVNN